MIYIFLSILFQINETKGVIKILKKGWEKEEIKKLKKELGEIEAKKKEMENKKVKILEEIEKLNFWLNF